MEGHGSQAGFSGSQTLVDSARAATRMRRLLADQVIACLSYACERTLVWSAASGLPRPLERPTVARSSRAQAGSFVVRLVSAAEPFAAASLTTTALVL
jgi:hypothetical protein